MTAVLQVCLHPLLPARSALALASEARSFVVKAALLAFPTPGVASLLADDVDPVIRFLALRHGWDLPETVRQRLQADPDVTKVTLLMCPE